LRSGEPRRERFEDNDSDEFAIGLVCGGTIEVCVHPVTPADYLAVMAALSGSAPSDSARTGPEPTAVVRRPASTGITTLTPRRAVGAQLTEAELARLHSPIGLDLGGRSAAERAVAIGAEIVALRDGGSALPRHTATGPIRGAIG
jgi:xanthine/CO dehydrogenase XdhC/CoxF family maturation factor